jgi:3-deoxy-D-manno-octulosonic-acid transferase
MRFLYSILWTLILPLALLRLFWRSRREAGYAVNVLQRLGLFGAVTRQSTIWLHAVSVGETRAAGPLIARLRDCYPDRRILLTQTTATGRATAQSLYGDSVTLAWLPWDLPWSQHAFLRAWRPDVGILMETELWPNLIAECRLAGVPLVLANARLSERSARRYARLSSLAGAMLQSLSGIAAQTNADAERLRALGARNVTVAGNLKFDQSPPPDQLALGARWRAALGTRHVALLASTREGEEAMLLPALQACLADDVLIALVPRHPQRFDEVARLVAGRGMTLVRRSAGTLPGADDRVWLGDSMGELFAWYALADLAVIGGSWLPLGGQNLIEACAAGCPVIIGPHTFNFAQAAEDALAAGAARRAGNADEMAAATCRLLADPASLKLMSDAGRAFAASHRGATERCMDLIRPLLPRLADDDHDTSHRSSLKP